MSDGTRFPQEDDPSAADEREDEGSQRFAVLDVFGLKLEVSNPRLAELLTMDAKDALGSDVKGLVPSGPPQATEPEVLLPPHTPHDEQDARMRREFRARVEEIGQVLGFTVSSDGLWTSPSGIAIVTRAMDKPVSLAAASHYVAEIAAHRESIPGPDATALFVVDSQQTADVFKVAIRQRRLYDLMRTISIDNLEDVRGMFEHHAVDHAQAVVLLVPITNIDVGEVLSIIRSARDAEQD